MVVDFSFLPKVLFAVLFDIAYRRDFRILITVVKVHIESPLQFERFSFFSALQKISFDFSHDVFSEFFVILFHCLSPLLPLRFMPEFLGAYIADAAL